MPSSQISIRRRLGLSLAVAFTVSTGILLIFTDQLIKRDRFQRHERLVMATAKEVESTINRSKGLIIDSNEKSLDKAYENILSDFSATRVVIWLSRPGKDPIFPENPAVSKFFEDKELLKQAGVNAPGMQKPRSFEFNGNTYFTCSMPLPDGQGVLRFLEDVGINPTVRTENIYSLLLIWVLLVIVSSLYIRQILTVGLSPLKRLEIIMDNVSLRSSGIVSNERVDLASEPRELLGIIASYNNLADRLQKAWTQQLLFARSVSHELITPLALIGSSSRRLLRRLENLSDKDKALLSSINTEVRAADHLIRDLVELARSDTGSLHIDMESIPLPSILTSLENDLNSLNWGNQCETNYVIPQVNADQINLQVNAERLRQCIGNLLENAHKYSPADSKIILSVSLVDGNVCFDITDLGKGIAEDEHELIFEPFRRGTKGVCDVSGSGVGLALVAELINLMNGKVHVLRSDDSGTTMRIKMPSYSV
jgi:two-component system, OmpR family, sensor kinase